MGESVYTRRMKIVKAGASDVPTMAAMVAKLFGIEKDFCADEAKQRRGLEAIVASEMAAAFLALDEASGESSTAAIGMVTAQLTISTAEGGPSGLLEDLYVEEAHRRKGVARLLVAEVEAWCRERGATRVQLLADRGNAVALAFYDGAGYGETRMVARRRMLGDRGWEAHFSS
jgi:GNAT superfamily N-acetyltransferase